MKKRRGRWSLLYMGRSTLFQTPAGGPAIICLDRSISTPWLHQGIRPTSVRIRTLGAMYAHNFEVKPAVLLQPTATKKAYDQLLFIICQFCRVAYGKIPGVNKRLQLASAWSRREAASFVARRPTMYPAHAWQGMIRLGTVLETMQRWDPVG